MVVRPSAAVAPSSIVRLVTLLLLDASVISVPPAAARVSGPTLANESSDLRDVGPAPVRTANVPLLALSSVSLAYWTVWDVVNVVARLLLPAPPSKWIVTLLAVTLTVVVASRTL